MQIRNLMILACLIWGSGQITLKSQSLYFPPINGDTWESIDPATLGWCAERIDSMYALLDENNTKAFLILKDGRIVLEKYFGTFTQDSIWYWASAGKSLTACLVGMAYQEGFLSLDDQTNTYLGEGWTSCTPEQEDQITIRHQLTMSSGLDDNVPDVDCTLDTCLIYKADAGARWAYHNAPYTLLDGVIEGATGQNLNAFFQQRLRTSTGMTGIFVPIEYNNVFFSKPRSMARFGLMILNKGNWDGNQVMTDTTYFNSMVNTSQALNLSYGYLWWLNGKPSYMLPSLQIVFPGSLMPHAPDDMIAALGKNGQYINVVPSQNLILVRMGNAPDGNKVPVTLNDKIWEHINGLVCGSTAVGDASDPVDALTIFPNPATDHISISFPNHHFQTMLYDAVGKRIAHLPSSFQTTEIPLRYAPGCYWVKVITSDGQSFGRKVIVL